MKHSRTRRPIERIIQVGHIGVVAGITLARGTGGQEVHAHALRRRSRN